mgnify:FL=1
MHFQDGRINYDEFAAMMRKGAGKLEGRLNEVLRDDADRWCGGEYGNLVLTLVEVVDSLSRTS